MSPARVKTRAHLTASGRPRSGLHLWTRGLGTNSRTPESHALRGRVRSRESKKMASLEVGRKPPRLLGTGQIRQHSYWKQKYSTLWSAKSSMNPTPCSLAEHSISHCRPQPQGYASRLT